jgi:hypothetical protein
MIDWDSDHILRTCKASAETLSATDWAEKWAALATQRRLPCIYAGEPVTWQWWLDDLMSYLELVGAQQVLEDAERRNELDEGCNNCTPHYNAVVDTIWRKLDERPPSGKERELVEVWAAVHLEEGYFTEEKVVDFLSHYPIEEPLSLGIEGEEPLALW